MQALFRHKFPNPKALHASIIQHHHQKSNIYRKGRKYNKKWCKKCQTKDCKYGTKKELKRLKKKHLRNCDCIHSNGNISKNQNKQSKQYDYQELYDAFDNIQEFDYFYNDSDASSTVDTEIPSKLIKRNPIHQIPPIFRHKPGKYTTKQSIAAYLHLNKDGLSGFITIDDFDKQHAQYWNKRIRLSSTTVHQFVNTWVHGSMDNNNLHFKLREYYYRSDIYIENVTLRVIVQITNELLRFYSPKITNTTWTITDRRCLTEPIQIRPCITHCITRNEIQPLILGYVTNYCNRWNIYIPLDILQVIRSYYFANHWKTASFIVTQRPFRSSWVYYSAVHYKYGSHHYRRRYQYPRPQIIVRASPMSWITYPSANVEKEVKKNKNVSIRYNPRCNCMHWVPLYQFGWDFCIDGR